MIGTIGRARHDAYGFLGRESLSLSIDDENGSQTASGIVGNGFVNLQESNGAVMGDVSTPRGIVNVDVQVRETNGGRSFNGFIGDAFVNLQESQGTIFGLVGNRNVNVRESDRGSDRVFDGSVGMGGFVNVTVNGHGEICDPVVVLLGLAN